MFQTSLFFGSFKKKNAFSLSTTCCVQNGEWYSLLRIEEWISVIPSHCAGVLQIVMLTLTVLDILF